MKDWNSIYKAKGIVQSLPSASAEAAAEGFKSEGLERILDLGCGTGRHTTLLIDRGFEVYGCDCSAEAVEIARSLIPEAEFRVCDMSSLPYDADFLDGILCYQVLQHGCIGDIRKACEEIRRVLRSGGRLYLVAVSTEHPKCQSGREIEPNTRIDMDALDGHIPHHFFTEDELRGLFADFDILKLEHVSGPSELEPGKDTAAWEMSARKRAERETAAV